METFSLVFPNNKPILEPLIREHLYHSCDVGRQPKILKKAVNLTKKFYETEASGGITLKNVKKIANTGVERISIGSLTHSFNSLDLKLEV